MLLIDGLPQHDEKEERTNVRPYDGEHLELFKKLGA
jgi:hypothetical protein